MLAGSIQQRCLAFVRLFDDSGGPGRSYLDPMRQRVDVLGGEFALRRHLHRAVITNGLDHGALGRIAGHNGHPTFRRRPDNCARGIEPYPAELHPAAVAVVTALRKHGANAALEEFGLLRRRDQGRRGLGEDRRKDCA